MASGGQQKIEIAPHAATTGQLPQRGMKTRDLRRDKEVAAAPEEGPAAAQGDTEIVLTRLNEASYAQMTLDWLAFQGIRTERDGWKKVRIPGRQKYRPFTRRIPADFSSASFSLGMKRSAAEFMQ